MSEDLVKIKRKLGMVFVLGKLSCKETDTKKSMTICVMGKAKHKLTVL